MLTLHHLKNSRSQRVIWLLEELNLEYEIVIHGRNTSSNKADSSLKTIHPLGKAPVLCDENNTIAETGAIFEYLIENYSRGRLQPPQHSREKLFYTYWRHFSEGSFMPYLSMKLVFDRIVRKSPFLLRPIIYQIFRVLNTRYLNPILIAELDYIEQHLTNYPWFAGEEFSAADIMIGFLLEAISGRMTNVEKYPYIASFIVHIRVRPAYQRAAQKGDWSETDFNQYWNFLAKNNGHKK